jgi:hypothetical protein
MAFQETYGPPKELFNATKLIGKSPLSGIPIPSITGGSAGQSGAYSGNGNVSIGGGSHTYLTIAVLGIVSIVGFIVWKKVH